MRKQLLQEARQFRVPFMFTVLFQFLLGVVVILQAMAFSDIITQTFLQGESLEAVFPTLTIATLLVVVRAVLSWASSRVATQLAVGVKDSLRRRLLAHVLALGAGYTRSERSGELANVMTEGIDALDAYYRDYLPSILIAVIVPISMLVVIAPIDLLTFLVLLITAPLIPFFMVLIGMATGALSRAQFEKMRFLSAHFLDVVQGLVTLKLFNRSQHQRHTIAKITDDFRQATMHVLRVAFLSSFTLEMLATLSVALVAVEIGVRLIYGNLQFEQALFLLVLAPEFYQPLRMLGAKFHAGTAGLASAERLYAILTLPVPNLSNERAPLPSMAQGVSVAFEGVTVRYGNGDPAVKGVTFTLEQGQQLALVGASGSGKTTLANLLLGFVPPSEGIVSVNGVDITTLALDSWREQVAWVSQSPYLFNASVRDNIRMGKPNATQAEIEAVAKRAHAHTFIQALPQGYDTLCGERGMRLSGGQAQRIALARAFLKDAPLVILDEATAHLDPLNEEAVIEALQDWLKGRTALIIAHRLNTLNAVNHIILLDKGRVRERGTPEQIRAYGGAYESLLVAFGEVRHA